jgi:hypothetical protein
MINYTERVSALMKDIVARVPALAFIDTSRVLVFARTGRSDADGAYATCHCVCLPPSEPGYYYWRDRRTGRPLRRSQWFVTKSPAVRIGGQQIDYLISLALPRFCDQSLSRSIKQAHYEGQPAWVAKLDTVVHELYHIDPTEPGIRRMERADGTYLAHCHGRRFLENVVSMVGQYLDSGPDPALYDFLKYDFRELSTEFGGVTGTSFRSFPSYPRRYMEVLDPQPEDRRRTFRRVEPMKLPRVATVFTEEDLTVREFLSQGSRRLREADQNSLRAPMKRVDQYLSV